MTVQVSARTPHQIGLVSGVRLLSRAALYRGLAVVAAVVVLAVCAGDRADASPPGSPAPVGGIPTSAALMP